jgi:hypothetical protein
MVVTKHPTNFVRLCEWNGTKLGGGGLNGGEMAGSVYIILQFLKLDGS